MLNLPLLQLRLIALNKLQLQTLAQLQRLVRQWRMKQQRSLLMRSMRASDHHFHGQVGESIATFRRARPDLHSLVLLRERASPIILRLFRADASLHFR